MDGTLGARISMLVDRHGSLRNVGKILGIDHAYLCRLQAGDKVNPSDAVLKKLGLQRVVTYKLRSKP
jgi:ferredoxin-fold anticodon binding domain-containing protein